jgi:hypothetical protein
VQSHRFRDQLNRFSLPVPAPVEPAPGAFMACPAAVLCLLSPVQWSWQQEIYRLALKQARAVARPSLLERDLLGSWN